MWILRWIKRFSFQKGKNVLLGPQWLVIKFEKIYLQSTSVHLLELLEHNTENLISYLKKKVKPESTTRAKVGLVHLWEYPEIKFWNKMYKRILRKDFKLISYSTKWLFMSKGRSWWRETKIWPCIYFLLHFLQISTKLTLCTPSANRTLYSWITSAGYSKKNITDNIDFFSKNI